MHLLAAILLVAGILPALQATVTSSDDSGEESLGPRAWIQYTRDGSARTATVHHVQGLEQYLSSRPNIFTAGPNALLESYAGEQMEDGPNKEDRVKRVNRRPTAIRDDSIEGNNFLEVVQSTNFYPEFAVGILENGCTAFLIGPRHALTTAHCVYNSTTSEFIDSLDFWRGRKQQYYLEQIQWESVIIPRNFTISPLDENNWALIVFSSASTSAVWLKIGFSENINDFPYTMYGYLSGKPYGAMYSTVCRSETQNPESENVFNLMCSSDECFDGGPLLRGYNFKRSKMPVAYGISLSSCDSYDFSHNSLVFQPELFWSLCYFMSENGFDARCAIHS